MLSRPEKIGVPAVADADAGQRPTRPDLFEMPDLAPRRPLLFEIAALLLRAVEVGALIGVSLLIMLLQGYTFADAVEVAMRHDKELYEAVQNLELPEPE